jgi:protein involved in polysaccharide export with SLBB domain
MKKLVVIVAGEVNKPGAIPFMTGGRVADYIAAAGGVDPKTANLNGIYLVDENFEKTIVNMTDEVEPGSTIFVNQNKLESSTYRLNKIMTFVIFFSALATLTSTTISIILAIRNRSSD